MLLTFLPILYIGNATTGKRRQITIASFQSRYIIVIKRTSAVNPSFNRLFISLSRACRINVVSFDSLDIKLPAPLSSIISMFDCIIFS